MKCPICGRDNPDIRLFCSRCGELLPETDDAPDARPIKSEDTDDDIRIYRRSGEKTSIEEESDVDFYRKRDRIRRVYEEAWPDINAEPKPPESLFEAENDNSNDADESAAASGERKPPILNRRNIADTGRASTLIPPREDIGIDDLFSVRGQTPVTRIPTPQAVKRGSTKTDKFDDAENQSFAMRHMRGIVAIVLLILTATIVMVWAFTPDAQKTLARLDIAWSAEAYESLGLEAYNAKDYSSAGHYFTKALERDSERESYAIYAANSYIEGGYISRAAEALRDLIRIAPNNTDYYITLMSICGGYEQMSSADKALIAEGFKLTGDERLDK